MPKYSRTAKYEELRSRLQSDSESDVRTNDLSQYEQRLNQIAPNQFGAPEKNPGSDADPIQGRRTAVYNEPKEAPLVQQPQNPDYSNSYLSNNANYTSAFNNEYLNEYIREVKQYNIDQGNAISANTDLNILKALKGETPAKPPVKPYPDEQQETIRVPSGRIEEIMPPTPTPQPSKPALSAPAPKPEPSKINAVRENDTADISFFNNSSDRPAADRPKPSSSVIDFLDDETAEREAPLSDTRTMSKEDIAAEVQRLINGAQQKRENAERKPARRRQQAEDLEQTDEYDDRTTRQQLLNETTQMRAQLDDYEDNLNDVSDKMKKTNQILNVVLIILIIALTLVLGVVIYWVLTSKGVIG